MDITQILQPRNIALAGGVFAIMQAAKMSVPGFFASPWGKRTAPIFPLVLGVGMAMAGLGEGATRWQDRLLMGLLAGFTAAHLFKVGRTTMLGVGTQPETSASMVPAEPSSESAKKEDAKKKDDASKEDVPPVEKSQE